MTRGQDDDGVIEKRMAAAKAEIAHYDEAEFIVLNDSFDRALEDLQSIVRACRLRRRGSVINCDQHCQISCLTRRGCYSTIGEACRYTARPFFRESRKWHG